MDITGSLYVAFAVLLPIVLIATISSALGGMLLVLCKIEYKTGFVVLGAYAFLGMFLGFCVGQSRQPMLGSTIAILIPILTALLGVLFKNQSDTLSKYGPAAFVSVAIAIGNMLMSMVYAAQLYKG